MLTDKMKRNIRRIVSRGRAELPKRSPNLHCRITERGNARNAFARYAENGMVAICRSGMDCDCTQYASVRIVPVPVSIVAWLKEEDEHNNWLDGPESMWLDRPSSHDNEESYRSADRAFEAYEDGHPSVVYWGDL